MTTKRTWRSLVEIAAVAALSSLFAVVLAGRSSGTDIKLLTDGSVDGPSAEATVTASRSDVVSQLSLSGLVVAHPVVVVVAPTSGVFTSALSPGLVQKGKPIGTVNGTALTMAFDTEVVRTLVLDGTAVSEGMPVAEVRIVGYAVEAEINGSDAYRVLSGSPLLGRGVIENGPGPFECTILRPADNADSTATTSKYNVDCLIPGDVQAIADVPATVALSSGVAQDVVVLPIEAVNGLVGTGEVTVVVGDQTQTRSVTLGITDGVVVEITAGLDEGEIVLARAPALAA